MATETLRNLWSGMNLERENILAAVGVLAILVIMVMPLPSAGLDLLLAFNLTVSLLVLLLSLYILKPLDFPIFPSLLLLTTLFRLSLNIASTRLILLHGHEGTNAAGRIIMSFGEFVVAGNYVVGGVIFFILVIINFVVITRGSGRIAEVAARFTLDAMPGKQMAIDADLNAGLIDEAEARRRRLEISREAEFYGAMDGASKFVRGEAIAGLVIMAINIIGGFVIGVFQQKMPVGEAAQSYTLLTIGDGLVSQIPAIVISTAAGILVSRAASEASMGREFSRQFAAQPEALMITAAVIFSFGMVPGLPAFPFTVLAAGTGTLAWLVYREKARAEALAPPPEEVEPEPEAPPAGSPEEVERLLALDILELEVGYGLIPLVDEQQGGDLLDRIRSIRRQFAQEMGVIVPPLHVRDNLQLGPGEYVILIKGIEIARGELMLGHLLAMDPGDAKQRIDGIPAREPAFGLPAIWIAEGRREEAQLAGYTVVDPSTVVATHLAEVIRQNAEELLGRQEVQRLLDALARSHPKAVEEATGTLSLGVIQKVLQNLVRERISIRDLLTIVETLADYGPMTRDPDILTEYVRQKLGRAIVKPLLGPDGTLTVLTLDPALEEQIRQGVQQTEQGSFMALDPAVARRIIQAVEQGAERAVHQGHPAVVLCSPSVRRHLRRLVERFVPNVTVLSHSEVPANVRLESLLTLR
ncbi:flagellar biosynthesis protein FlhA [Dissulfurirhabdus thermomarina]|uniref:Flagellar biosynthesis protein FlhA n=1 Tax=Dissulfurirhabdus thermomarina TaxID=1765737 RepID=A0A6N9TNT3_DISTH|nr:flagellar biosynthesis protein FlhA [Dissulfurirhabdus thermomarina]NDY42708.1 flagellar biosynthesis protein FlhA [Dissulfurirhabdus thermomarina]NMX24461.1 flagellar biosynthesis protein FlhA [Dissulfurirhabdus thermomarina]